MREFIVRKGCLGYTVTIGCQVCGFTKVKELKKAICEYLDDPEGTEKKYYKSKECEDVRATVRYPDVLAQAEKNPGEPVTIRRYE